ncbi:MAG: hypothetical protein CMJ46_16080 [Planctomyces sp.]|nr:hypothetical protein [Planctomyces sp.]
MKEVEAEPAAEPDSEPVASEATTTEPEAIEDNPFITNEDSDTSVEGAEEAEEMEVDTSPVSDADKTAVTEVVDGYFAAGKANDIEKMKTFVTTKSQAFEDSPASGLGEEAKINIKEVTFDEGIAQAVVALETPVGEAPAYLKLKREEGNWRIFGFGFGDPAEIEAGLSFFLNYEEVDPTEFGGGEDDDFMAMSDDEPEIKLAGTHSGDGVETELYLTFDENAGMYFAQGGDEPSLLIGSLKFKGPKIKGATAYGFLKIDIAEDDQGTKLKLHSNPFADEGTFTKSMGMMGMAPYDFNEEEERTSIEVPLVLDRPAAAATQLAKLEGSVQIMAGGEIKDVVVDNVLSKIASDVEDETLKQAGVTVKLKAREEEEFSNEDSKLILEVTGDRNVIQSFKLTSPSKRYIPVGTSWGQIEDRTVVNFITPENLPEDTQLVMTLAIGQEAVTVPFSFENAELPANPDANPAGADIVTSLKLSAEKETGPFDERPNMKATLTITGMAIGAASEYGEFKLDLAQDEYGTPLKLVAPAQDESGDDIEKQFVPIAPPAGDAPGTVTMTMTLSPPGKEADTATLAGSIQLKNADGSQTEVPFQFEGHRLPVQGW